MNSALVSLVSLLGGSYLTAIACALPNTSSTSPHATEQASTTPEHRAIAQATDAASMTAAEFYNQYKDQVSNIPLPDCATETSDLTRDEIQQIVLEHNRSRADADLYVPNGLPDLPAVTWNCDAAAIAQRWATESQGTRGHSPREWREGLFSDRTGLQGDAASLGENLGWAVASAPSAVDPVVSSIVSWDNERANYNHNSSSCGGGVCGHYTQIVWRESTEVGCGVTRNQIQLPGQNTTWPYGYFLACNYHHAGNINGDNPLIDHPDWYYQ